MEELLPNVLDWRDRAAMFLTPFTSTAPDKTSGSIGHRGVGSCGMIAIFLGAGRYS